MVNQPAYNPNDRDQIKAKTYRNRAVTDIVEPGSSIKPFVVAAGLASGRFNDRSIIDTNPGYIKVGAKLLEDPHNLGAVNLATILAKSSNVGMTKVALSLEPAQMYGTLSALGFGQVTTSAVIRASPPACCLTTRTGGPWASRRCRAATGCRSRRCSSRTPTRRWRRRRVAAHFVPARGDAARRRACARSRRVAHAGPPARGRGGARRRRQAGRDPGYTVAGKTGTAWKATAGGYATDRYLAVFGGIAPASAPRLAAVVIIDEPGAGKYYGGDVAAPVFSGVVGGALRLLAVPPDAPVGDEQRGRAPGGHAMNVTTAAPQSLARLLEGIATLPRDVTISDLTQDGRAAQPGGAFLAIHGTRNTASSTRRRRWPMARARCCGSPRRSRWFRICLRRSWSRRCRDCASTPARSPIASSARLRRAWPWPASPAPMARPPAPIYSRRRWKAAAGRPLHGHHRHRSPAP